MPIFAQVKEFSIIDPIQEELDKELISDGKVIAEVRSKILSEVNKIAEKFDVVIKKVWIVGSSISYQYLAIWIEFSSNFEFKYLI